MNVLKKIIAWLRGPRSDLFLFIVALALLNLVSVNSFVRLDLTSKHSYSLSPASREVMRTLEAPLAVKVFFSDNLPAPYNSAGRYLKDLLVEYKGVAGRKFSYESFDMDKADNQELARSYGIPMAQVQELKDNEVGVKNAYMGLALIYSDSIEVIENVAMTDGLEYRLTTTIGKMIARTNTLAGLSGKVKVTLYASSSFAPLGIGGFRDLDRVLSDATAELNRKNLDRIEYLRVDPAPGADTEAVAEKYGLQIISWSTKPSSVSASSGASAKPDGSGVLGVVLEYGDRFRTVPLALAQTLFGGYGIAGLDTLRDTLEANLQGLMANSPSIGYVVGHGEKALNDDREGSSRLASVVADTYEFREVNTAKDSIPADITTLVINGPRSAFTEAELYRIDQFVLRGGNLFLLLDPFEEIRGEGSMAYYGAEPSYRPIDTGLERIVKAYGIIPGKNYVLDKACYVSRRQGSPEVPLYYVPRLAKESLNRKNPVSRDLADVIFLQASALEIETSASSADRTVVPLATSSGESWLMADNINLAPYAMEAPGPDKMAAQNLAVLAEGKFESAFGATPPTVSGIDGKATGATAFSAKDHLAKSLLPSRVIVIGTSAITGPAVIDREGREPVAIFVRNAIDYLADNGGLIEMRTKGLALNQLDRTTKSVRTAARAVNLYGLPVVVVLLGLLAWRLREVRRKRIAERYAAGAKKTGEA